LERKHPASSRGGPGSSVRIHLVTGGGGESGTGPRAEAFERKETDVLQRKPIAFFLGMGGRKGEHNKTSSRDAKTIKLLEGSAGESRATMHRRTKENSIHGQPVRGKTAVGWGGPPQTKKRQKRGRARTNTRAGHGFARPTTYAGSWELKKSSDDIRSTNG